MPGKIGVNIMQFHQTKNTQFYKLQNIWRKIKYLPARKGERFASALTNMNLSNSIINISGIKSIKEYIHEFKKKEM